MWSIGAALPAAAAAVYTGGTPLLPTMRRFWLLFSQTVTVLVAAWFVVATLKPDWVRRPAALVTQGTGVQLVEAPTPANGPAPPGSFRAAAQRASAAVVSINTSKAPARNPNANDPWFRFFFGEQGDAPPQMGLGSGVILSTDGYILTNNHVVESADEIEVTLNDSRTARAKVIGTDPDTDLAVLRISLERLPIITLGNSDALQVGDQVLAIGNPFGVGQTVTSGIVSALGRNQLGINTAIYSRSGGSMGIGFAIPVSTAKQVLEGIVKDGVVRRGWIGVEPAELSPDLMETFGVKARRGVLITGVLQNGPAAQAGVRPGDVITEVAGKSVANVSELMTNVAALKPGTAAPFKLQRRDDEVQVSVTPGLRPKPPSAQR